ncbi:hypothetical protein [Celeribacter neptunius]|uniref:Uncharacterized protein n=1 Tax=Celeribacter neptunius TaxID=588602 RepID=A0A1I3N879_9RHOB|nr:hypothetical protein [Celeribacter neptunius]SFJ05463.1 hypothetical protein SAMN04487991_1292 [Celeribacter neptunius]
MKHVWGPVSAMVALTMLAGCAEPMGRTTEDGFLTKLPEGLAEIVAPHQDLTAVMVNPDDGCYWYEHDGPVETTLLPLRALDGRPICTVAQELTTAM